MRIRRLIFLALITAGAGLACVLFISMASYFLFLLPPVQQRALRFAESQLNERLVGEFTVDRLETDLLRRIELFGIHAYGEHNDSIYVKKVSARFSLSGLLRKTVRIRTVDIHGLTGNVVHDQGIKLPVLPVRSKDSPNRERRTRSGSTWQIDIGKVRVHSLSAEYLTPTMRGEIRDAKIEADFHSIDSFSVVLNAEHAEYESPWWNGNFDHLQAQGVITFEYFDVSSFVASGSGTRVNGSGHIPFRSTGEWDVAADFQTYIEPVTVVQNILPDLAPSSFFYGSASWKGSLDDPRLEANVSGRDVIYSGYGFDHTRISATYGANKRVNLSAMIASQYLDLNLSSHVQIDSLMRSPRFGEYLIDADLKNVAIGEVRNYLGVSHEIPGEKGEMKIRASGAGFEALPEIRLSALIEGGVLEQNALEIESSLRNSNWNLKCVVGQNLLVGEGSISGLENLSVNGNLTLDFDSPEIISRFILQESISGRLVSEVHIDGELVNPHIKASITGKEVKWRGSELGSADAEIAITERNLHINEAQLQGSVKLDSLLGYLGVEGGGGEIDLEAYFTGSVEDLFIHASIEGKELQYMDHSIGEAVGIVTLEGGDTLRWNNLQLHRDAASFTSNGELVLGSEMQFALNSHIYEHNNILRERGHLVVMGRVSADSAQVNYSVTDLDISLAENWIKTDVEFSGVMSSSGFIDGAISNPYAVISLGVEELSLDSREIGHIESRIIVSDSLLNLDAQLIAGQFPSMSLSASGQLALSPGKNWSLDNSEDRSSQLQIEGQSLNLSWIPSIIGEGIEAQGPLSFNASLEKKPSDNWDLSGNLILRDGEVNYTPEQISVLDIEIDAAIRGSLETPRIAFSLSTGTIETPHGMVKNSSITGNSLLDTLQLDSVMFVFEEGGSATANVKIPYSSMGAIFSEDGLVAEYNISEFPFAMLSPFMPDYSFRRGIINSKGEVKIAQGRPLINGELSVSNAEFSIPDINPSIRSVNALIAFKDSEVIAEDLRARWGNGRIRGEGKTEWDLEGLKNLDMRFRGSNLNFELPEVIQIGVNRADIRITDRSNGFLISGSARMGQTRYIRDIRITDMIQQIQTGSRIEREPNPLLQSIMLRIDVDLADNFTIDMNIGNLDLDGRVTVGGNAADPGIVGEIKVVEGYVFYLDRRFYITEGELFNPDPLELNPNLNLQAQTSVYAFSAEESSTLYTIRMSLTGTLEDPIVRFSSEPDLNELDIFSVLTLGQTFGSIGPDIRDRLRVFATQQIAGFGARKLEQLFGLDRIDFTGDILGRDETARLSITKRFTDRLMLTYETPVENMIEGKMTAHYRITPNIYLEGQATTEGDNGIDLIFRFSR
ncbi:protein of unknown function DUF490 [Chitinispirillum alkaliphilum]|nr:protein of unknown function DUF490 [Chitinispirillum alkaliphilum]